MDVHRSVFHWVSVNTLPGVDVRYKSEVTTRTVGVFVRDRDLVVLLVKVVVRKVSTVTLKFE